METLQRKSSFLKRTTTRVWEKKNFCHKWDDVDDDDDVKKVKKLLTREKWQFLCKF